MRSARLYIASQCARQRLRLCTPSRAPRERGGVHPAPGSARESPSETNPRGTRCRAAGLAPHPAEKGRLPSRTQPEDTALAIYHLSAKVIGRSTGRSATGAAAYRAAEVVRDDRTGIVHDYTRKGGVEHREILAPDNAPAWMRDREALWNAVEKAEARKDAQLAREVEVALPRELSSEQRLDLVRGFVREEFVARGMVADVAVHNPRHPDGEERPHAHVMLTMRCLTAEGFGPKDRSWNAKDVLEGWRERWEAHANRALDRAGRDERIDHRSFADRGVDREPQPKLGPVATAMERRGVPTERGDELRVVEARNIEREGLRGQLDAVRMALVELRDRTAETVGRGVEAARNLLGTIKERVGSWLGSGQERLITKPARTAPASQFGQDKDGPQKAPPVDRDTLLGRSEGVNPQESRAVDRDTLLGKNQGGARQSGSASRNILLGRPDGKGAVDYDRIGERDDRDRGR